MVVTQAKSRTLALSIIRSLNLPILFVGSQANFIMIAGVFPFNVAKRTLYTGINKTKPLGEFICIFQTCVFTKQDGDSKDSLPLK